MRECRDPQERGTGVYTDRESRHEREHGGTWWRRDPRHSRAGVSLSSAVIFSASALTFVPINPRLSTSSTPQLPARRPRRQTASREPLSPSPSLQMSNGRHIGTLIVVILKAVCVYPLPWPWPLLTTRLRVPEEPAKQASHRQARSVLSSHLQRGEAAHKGNQAWRAAP